MKTVFLSLFTLFLFVASASKQEQVELIKSHLKKSEEATTISLRGDKAIFHAVLAENLFRDYSIEDVELEKEIQLKFIGAFRLVNQPDNARIHLKRLISILEKEERFATRGYFLNVGRLASDYLRAGELDSALHYFLVANKSAQQFGIPRYHASSLNNLGLLYEKKEDWETAIQYYNRASSILSEGNAADSAFLTSIRDNQAKYYLHAKDTARGIKLLRSNINYLTKQPDQYKRVLNYGFKLFDILTLRGDWQEANALLTTLESFLQLGRHNWYFENQIRFHESNLKLIKHDGDQVALLDGYRILDSLKSLELKRAEDRRVLLNNTMTDYFLLSADADIEREKEKTIQAKRDNDRKTLFIAFLIVIFVAISFLLKSSSKRRLRAEKAERKIKEQALKLTELENERLSRDLHHTSNDFSDLMMQTSLKEDWGGELIKQLEELNKTKDQIDALKLKEIIRGLKQKSGVYDKVNLQQKGISKVNSAFFDHLDAKYPKLTKSERELCGLLRLRLDGKEIAVIRNIHPSSVRKLRHRLRKKLGIEADVDIYEFIAKI